MLRPVVWSRSRVWSSGTGSSFSQISIGAEHNAASAAAWLVVVVSEHIQNAGFVCVVPKIKKRKSRLGVPTKKRGLNLPNVPRYLALTYSTLTKKPTLWAFAHNYQG